MSENRSSAYNTAWRKESTQQTFAVSTTIIFHRVTDSTTKAIFLLFMNNAVMRISVHASGCTYIHSVSRSVLASEVAASHQGLFQLEFTLNNIK